MVATSFGVDIESSKIFLISPAADDNEDDAVAEDLVQDDYEFVEVKLEPVDEKAADSDDTSSKEEGQEDEDDDDDSAAEVVVIKEVESGFNKLSVDNQKTEKDEVDEIVSKVSKLFDAVVAVAQAEAKAAIEKEVADAPIKALEKAAASYISKTDTIGKVEHAANDKIKSIQKIHGYAQKSNDKVEHELI